MSEIHELKLGGFTTTLDLDNPKDLAFVLRGGPGKKGLPDSPLKTRAMALAADRIDRLQMTLNLLNESKSYIQAARELVKSRLGSPVDGDLREIDEKAAALIAEIERLHGS